MVKVIEKNKIKIGRELWVLPKMSKKEYEAAWQRFEKLLKKAGQLWKAKKSALDILREERE